MQPAHSKVEHAEAAASVLDEAILAPLGVVAKAQVAARHRQTKAVAGAAPQRVVQAGVDGGGP